MDNMGMNYSSDQVIYWILLNDDRYFGAETFQEAQRLITIFRLMGCPDKLEIEADYEGDQ